MKLKERSNIKLFREDLTGNEPYPKRSNINELYPSRKSDLRDIMKEMLDSKTARDKN